MTSGISSVKLWKQSVKQNSAAGILMMLIYFCIYPIPIMLLISRQIQTEEERQYLIQKLVSDSCYNNAALILTMLSAAVLGILLFAYLHSREKVDFYHSHAIRREKFFLIRYAGGVIIWMAPFLINIFMIMAIIAAKGYLTFAIVRRIGESVLVHLIVFLVIFSFMILAMMLTGKIYVAILGMMVFCTYIPAVRIIWAGLCEIYLKTYYQDSMTEVLTLSPVYACWKLFSDFVSEYNKINDRALVLFLIILVTGIITVCFYRKRSSESAGNAMAFGGFAKIVKFLLVIPMSLAGELFFTSLGSQNGESWNMAWGIFGFVFTFILANAVIEFIYHMDLRELFRDKKQIVLTAAASTILLCTFVFDLTGYDRWMPKEEDVSEIGLNISCFSAVDIMEYEIYIDENGDITYSPSWRGYDTMYETADTKDVMTFIENCQRTRQNPQGDYNMSFEVDWKMKNGTVKKRQYYCDEADKEAYFTPIFERKDFKEAMAPSLALQEKEIQDIQIENTMVDDEVNTENVNLTKKQREELFDTLKKEVLSLTQEEWYDGGEYVLTVLYLDQNHQLCGNRFWISSSLPETKKLLTEYGYHF